MGKRDSRVDAYIKKSPDFAKPILTHIRAVVHEGCPDCEETLKWSAPTFMYHGILCGMAAFKEYCALVFWKGALIIGPDGKTADDSAGQFGRIRSVSDLPPKRALLGYVREAMKLNEEGIKVPRRKTTPKKPLKAPDYFASALRKNRKAAATFEKFSPSHRREYVEWITGAKTDETRERRLTQAVEWITEGKSRNWKYERR
jgi:uncharacterized protein YdeI (YjbR/CyaY-like superfamily)